MKVAFFDRDGKIIEDYPDQEWTHIKNPSYFHTTASTFTVNPSDIITENKDM